nr:immunoglobulin heavy chain junction region [Mus musculus]NSM04751.1 immunoglobulin heavy chain junction region [Mus musculus]NSM07324.1 immunoglobulin heavy chain junction region [Mus musculus]NSM07758.1 immunoglobulin heavy chain junction region [Mus musculus]NSM07937.1 immunoglobulin heavy chain junction region [Mus musculus]
CARSGYDYFFAYW